MSTIHIFSVLKELTNALSITDHKKRISKVRKIIDSIPKHLDRDDWVVIGKLLAANYHLLNIKIYSLFLHKCPYMNTKEVPNDKKPIFTFGDRLLRESVAALAIAGVRKSTKYDTHSMLTALFAAQFMNVYLGKPLFGRWRAKFGTWNEERQEKVLPPIVEEQIKKHLDKFEGRKYMSPRNRERWALEELGFKLVKEYETHNGYIKQVWVHEEEGRKEEVLYKAPDTDNNNNTEGLKKMLGVNEEETMPKTAESIADAAE